ncbi:MAG: ATP-binding domain-containing protein, partial [Firmicutes bacterium]|nr:ATP-binding domain-containing protein [Bacillota bacterium]
SIQALENQLTNYLEAGYQTIAIICPTVSQCQSIFDQLRQRNSQLELSILNHEKATFKSGIVVVPVYLAKGLEFDAVILPEVSSQIYEQEYQRRLLYVACSRALHELSLIYTDELSPFIQGLPPYLYEAIE